jgi:hypothetical protein
MTFDGRALFDYENGFAAILLRANNKLIDAGQWREFGLKV